MRNQITFKVGVETSRTGNSSRRVRRERHGMTPWTLAVFFVEAGVLALGLAHLWGQ
ncbi:MAG: hypothetical protein R3B68_16535 [Phycisphaerales bacterium]